LMEQKVFPSSGSALVKRKLRPLPRPSMEICVRSDRKDSAPEHPFYREFPGENPEHTYQINSGPARPEAQDHTYEAHFHFEDGSEADPHIRVGP